MMTDEVNNNIAFLRSTRGLTQTELGRQVGVCAVTISRWESGTASPCLDHVYRVASTLGVPASSLVKNSHDVRTTMISLLRDNARLHRENTELHQQITRLRSTAPDAARRRVAAQ